MIARHTIARILLSVLSIAWAGAAAAQGDEIADALSRGKQRYQENCGICHGLDAKGAGAFTEILNVPPPDLTTLSSLNGGSFPFLRLYEIIDGRRIPAAHGTRLMPIWGNRYSAAVADGNETLVRGRILELLVYLESVQAD